MRLHGGATDGQLIRVQGEKCTIGSAPTCTVRLASSAFQPLHCLMVRGRGGVVVRRWSDKTKLNGEDFTVSWMWPGDRLGLGPIELELLSSDATETDAVHSTTGQCSSGPHTDRSDANRQQSRRLNKARICQLCQRLRELKTQARQLGADLDAARQERDEALGDVSAWQQRLQRQQQQWEQVRHSLLEERDQLEAEIIAERKTLDEERRELEMRLGAPPSSGYEMSPASCDEEIEESVSAAELVRVKEELSEAQEFLGQLLGERQELLERLALLQQDLENRDAADSGQISAADWEAERQRLEETHRRQVEQLQADLREAAAERHLMQAIVAELREEVSVIGELRWKWQDAKEQLQGQLEQAILERDAAQQLSQQYIDATDEATAANAWRPPESYSVTDTDATSQEGRLDDVGRSQLSKDAVEVQESDLGTPWTPDQSPQFTYPGEKAESGDTTGKDDDWRSQPWSNTHQASGIRFGSADEPELTDDLAETDDAACAAETPPIVRRRTAARQIDLTAMRDVANQSAGRDRPCCPPARITGGHAEVDDRSLCDHDRGRRYGDHQGGCRSGDNAGRTMLGHRNLVDIRGNAPVWEGGADSSAARRAQVGDGSSRAEARNSGRHGCGLR